MFMIGRWRIAMIIWQQWYDNKSKPVEAPSFILECITEIADRSFQDASCG